MLHNTQGIVIKATKYAETSLVAQILTRDLGMQGFLVQGAYRKKSAFQPSHFQHLNQLEMEVYYKPGRQLQKIKELKINPVYNAIPFQIEKTSLAIFMAEVLNKTVQEEEANTDLFDYLAQLIQLLDQWQGSLANFPLFFLVKLSTFLGFYPRNNLASDRSYFNLMEGTFQSKKPEEGYGIYPPESEYLSLIIQANTESLSNLTIPRETRQYLLDKLLDYFRLHLSAFSRVQSSTVIREVLQA